MDMTTAKKNVLVIGETGSGKSSLINLIVGGNVAPVSSSITGETFAMNRYEYGTYILYDMMDYNDAIETSRITTCLKLRKFRNDISHEGISLIIFAMKKGRITASSRNNYDYFTKSFCDGKVPVLLVVTHYEDESAKGNWLPSQREKFEEFEMTFNGVVCGCAIDIQSSTLDPEFLSSFTKKRDKTQVDVRSKIQEFILAEPWKPCGWGERLPGIFTGALALGVAMGVLYMIFPRSPSNVLTYNKTSNKTL